MTSYSTRISNAKFLREMKKAGLGKVDLYKGDGYFYIDSDDDTIAAKISHLQDTDIYVCHFNQMTIHEWVNEIQRLINE